MDGELDAEQRANACERCRGRVPMATWECYHWIGDYLRGCDELSRRAFATAFVAQLRAEPTVLAPPRLRAVAGCRCVGAGGQRRGGRRGRLGGADRPCRCRNARGRDRAAGCGAHPSIVRRPVDRRIPVRASGILADDGDPGRAAVFARSRGRHAGCAGVTAWPRQRPAASPARQMRRHGRRCAVVAAGRGRRGRGQWLQQARERRAAAQLRRHARLPARRARRNLARDAHGRRARRAREAGQSRRSGARGDPHQRRGSLLLSGCENHPRRAANLPQRLPVAAADAARYAGRVLQFFRKAETARIAGVETQAFVFEPKDGMRYGHKLWADIDTGLLLKAQLLNEQNVPIEQFVFTDIDDRRQDRARHGEVRRTGRRPADWVDARSRCPATWCRRIPAGMVKDLPPGFSKIVEGYRTLRGKVGPRRAPRLLATAWSRYRCSSSRCRSRRSRSARRSRGASTSTAARLDEHLVTVLGETPGATVRQIADFRRPPLTAAPRRASSSDIKTRDKQHETSHRGRSSPRSWAPLAFRLGDRSAVGGGACPTSPSSTSSRGRPWCSIDVTQTVRRSPFPDLSEDDPFYEFFRRFGQIPRGPRAAARSGAAVARLGLHHLRDGYILTNAHVVDGASEVPCA